jgi:hypothetical protein
MLPFKKIVFDSLTLKPFGLYVNLLGRLVAYSQPFNLVVFFLEVSKMNVY